MSEGFLFLGLRHTQPKTYEVLKNLSILYQSGILIQDKISQKKLLRYRNSPFYILVSN